MVNGLYFIAVLSTIQSAWQHSPIDTHTHVGPYCFKCVERGTQTTNKAQKDTHNRTVYYYTFNNEHFFIMLNPVFFLLMLSLIKHTIIWWYRQPTSCMTYFHDWIESTKLWALYVCILYEALVMSMAIHPITLCALLCWTPYTLSSLPLVLCLGPGHCIWLLLCCAVCAFSLV